VLAPAVSFCPSWPPIKPIINSMMPIIRTKNERPKARKFELSNTTTPSDSRIRKSPDPEVHNFPFVGFAWVDKIPLLSGGVVERMPLLHNILPSNCGLELEQLHILSRSHKQGIPLHVQLYEM